MRKQSNAAANAIGDTSLSSLYAAHQKKSGKVVPTLPLERY